MLKCPLEYASFCMQQIGEYAANFPQQINDRWTIEMREDHCSIVGWMFEYDQILAALQDKIKDIPQVDFNGQLLIGGLDVRPQRRT